MVRVLVDNIKQYAKDNRVPIMQDGGIEFIIKYIKEHDVKSVLEIGSAIGYSAIMFASVNDDITVTTIERDDNMYEKAIQNICDCHLDNRISVIHGDALEVDIVGKYDLIFIDAAKSQYIKFFEKYKDNLNDDGAIISDNLAFHGLVEDDTKIMSRNTRQLVKKIRKYIDFLKNNTEFETEFINVGDGVSVSKRVQKTCNND
ncbi:MAG: O-methyltransferase [Bacilli bacterium]|nr:O-methyltransferase [Bacilli bacterium]